MRITVLTDNTPHGELMGEWGLSLYIESAGHTLLLDAGASGLFKENAEKLSLPLDKVEAAVLSHAHYDHGDGLSGFLKANERAKLYVRAACAEDCYSCHGSLLPHYVGLAKGLLTAYGDRLVRVEGRKEIMPGVWLLPHTESGLESIGRKEKLYRRRGLLLRPDGFDHEQSMVLDTPKGLVILNSCCHGGADRVIREALAAFPGKKPRAILGGFHLFGRSDAEVASFARRLLDTGVEAVYTGHCTGDRAMGILKEILGSRLHPFHAGLEIQIEE